jgi:hypothetical protein
VIDLVVGLANLTHVGASLEKDVGFLLIYLFRVPVWLMASGVDLAGITRMHRMQARALVRGSVTANAAQAVGFL